MKIPGLETLFEDIEERTDNMQGTLDGMQETLNRIETLLIKIEENTRRKSDPFQLYAEKEPKI